MKTKRISPKKLKLILLFFLLFGAYSSHAKIHYYSNLGDLLKFVGHICKTPTDNVIYFPIPTDPNDEVHPGDIIMFNGTDPINLDELSTYAVGCTIGTPSLPLIVPAGATLAGNYDLLSESFDYTDPVSSLTTTFSTNPQGTLFYSNTFRQQLNTASVPVTTSRHTDYFFTMKPADPAFPTYPTCIRNIHIKGSTFNWTDFNTGVGVNSDKLYSGAIKVYRPCKFNDQIAGSCPGYDGHSYQIKNCEIEGFSLAGIWFEDQTDDILIENCYIHHIKGISNIGIGYGVIMRSGEPLVIYDDDPANWNMELKGNIFDECKDAFDGDVAGFDINFNKNTMLNFAGGINRHNTEGSCATFNHDPTSSGYMFFSREVKNSTCQHLNLCLDGGSGFAINDLTQGHTWFRNNIFYKDGISIPYPGENGSGGISPFALAVDDNTFMQAHEKPDDLGVCGPNNDGEVLKHGYAQIADNYIENYVWNNDPWFTHTGNSFSYTPGKIIESSSAPQPPEVWLELLNPNNNSPLPTTTNRSQTPGKNFTQYLNSGNQFLLSAKPGRFGSTNLSYIIRYNTSEEPSASTGSVTQSSNNYYYHDQEITTPSTGNYISLPKEYLDNGSTPLTGLFGIDVLAIANDNGSGSANWEKYQTSSWQHIPLIVPPADGDRHLIFNIKDSYQEFHNALANPGCPNCPTGIHKQVELNGIAIWSEDIGDGGDGWERVSVDLSTHMNLFNTNGGKNTITFSIAIPDPGFPGNAEMIKGLLVWVDDVYLKKNITPANLIVNGDLEQAEELNTSAWYEKNKTHFDCGVSSLIPNDLVYPDGTPLVSQPPLQISTQVDLTTIDRKSGHQSIILKLPKFTFAPCTDYYNSINYPDPDQPQGVLISAATDIDFTDFLTCAEYLNLAHYTELVQSPNISITAGQNYYVTQSLILANDIKFDRNIVAFYPGVTITVPSGRTLEMEPVDQSLNPGERTILFGCEEMWGGIVNNGGTVYLEGEDQMHHEIYDAEIALNSTGGLVKIENINFDQNYTALRLEGTFNNNSFINSSRFSCSTGVLTKPSNSGSHLGKMPDHHIHLNLVHGLANANPFPVGYYGSNSSAAFINNFSDAINGIWSNNSKYNVFRSDFTMSPQTTATTSYGIYAIGQTSAINNSVSIIPNLNGDINTFSNLRHAMFTNGVESFTSIGNDVDNCTFGIKSNGAVDVKIDDNTISNFQTGIGVYDIDVRSTYNFKQILNNKLNVGIPLDQLSHYGMTGIDIQNIITHTSPITISKNTIYNSAIGIHGRNATNLTIGVDAGSFNRITDEMPLDNTFHYGIWMENSSFARINNNEVKWTGGTVNDPAYLRSHTGIGISRSLSCTVNGNTIINYGGGFKIFDDCSQTELRCNTMDHCYHGVYFDVNGMNNLISPNQGIYTGVQANDVSWNNQWINTLSGVNKVDGSVPPNFSIKWVYDINSAIQFDPDPSGSFVSRQPGNSHLTCP